jgi:hypothetical protein
MVRIYNSSDVEQTQYTPKYEHDCTSCIFLGHREGLDIYYHEKDILGPTLIARRSSEPSDYSSGASFVTSNKCFHDSMIEPEAWVNVTAAVFIEYVLKHKLIQAPVAVT